MISLTNISKHFGGKSLFANLSLHIGDGDRIALVGPNGAGKSTLMKIIAGQIVSDTGSIHCSRFTSAGYLPQDNLYHEGRTLFEEVATVFEDVKDLHRKIEVISAELNRRSGPGETDDSDIKELVDELGRLQHLIEYRDGYTIDAKIKQILSGLGFHENDAGRMTNEFSGGWQMRIEIAKLLLQEPSTLLLDEPTNHLDIESLQWLESYLKPYRGSIVLVSHDSRFLDALVTRIVEIVNGRTSLYTGNFSSYVRQKAIRDIQHHAAYHEQQQLIEKTERFIGRHRYDKKRAKQVQSRLKMLEKMDRIEMEHEDKAISFHFPETARPGKVMIALERVKKSYASTTVFEDLSLRIDRGDTIALLGTNGSGKSTLARIIAGREPFQGGTRTLGHNVTVSYFAQNLAESLDPDKTVLETLETVGHGNAPRELRTLLGSFLFSGDDVFKTVHVLSGGEKSRLAIARMLLVPANLLVFDEPTNHLDTHSKAVLQESLKRFSGSYVIVSHDRDFLAPLINTVLYMKDGVATVHKGSVDEFLERREVTEQSTSEIHQFPGKKSLQNQEKARKREEAEKRQRLYHYLKPLKDTRDALEEEIARAEQRKAEIESAFADAATYERENGIQSLHIEHDRLATVLDALYDQWDETEKKIDEISNAYTE